MLFAPLFIIVGMGVGYNAGTIVVYAEVKNVQQTEGPSHIIKLDPLSTLMGDLDPSMEVSISAAVSIGGNVSEIAEPPPVGAKVICLLSRVTSKTRRDNIRFTITNGVMTHFPKQINGKESPAMFIVSGFDDPKVKETIENLRKYRAKDREEAEQKARQ